MKLAVTPEEQRAWAAQWKKAGLALEEVKGRELRALTEQEACIAAERVMELVTFPRPPRATGNGSGLVEQQRFFAKAKY